MRIGKIISVLTVLAAFGGSIGDGIFGGKAFAQSAPLAQTQPTIEQNHTSLSVDVSAPDLFVDLVAAEFFEDRLRLAQSRKIEAATARNYLTLSAEARAKFREERKRQWENMSAAEKAHLRGAKLPTFDNLTEQQKLPFRQIALRELGVITPYPLASSDSGDI